MEQPEARPAAAPPTQPSGRPPGGRRALAWFRLLHPFPSLVVAATGVGFAALAAPQPLRPDHIARLAGMLAASQFAVGAYNDYCDVDLDAVAKPGRPIPAGLVPPRGALLVVVALVAITLGLAASFGAPTLGFAIPGAGAGLVYDRVFKRTVWSWVPYVLGLPVLPLWSWSTLGALPPAAGWAYPCGALLALALHLANALPDEASDRAARAGGLVASLGRPATLLLLSASFALAVVCGLAVIGLGLGLGSPRSGLALLGLIVGGGVGAAGLILVVRPATDRLAFPLLAVGGGVLATGVAAALVSR